ncbi:MAG: TetR/AcrR family transcriptional regulator [Alcaligenaceae bacterium]|nr:TetR/AcrR family transcriptional regulator [Alcaligenaceae bacterium]
MSTQNKTEDSPRVAKRRAQLVQAAITQFSRLGYHTTTIKDIADEAGVSPGLIYQYVPDKQELLFLALQHIVQRNDTELPLALEGVVDPIARLYRAVESYTYVIDTSRQASQLTYREMRSLKPEYIEHVKQLELQTNGLIVKCVDDCIRAGYLAETHVELLVYRIVIAAQGWALKHWRLKHIVTLDEYLDKAIHAIWKSLLLPRGTSRYEELHQAGELEPLKRPRDNGQPLKDANNDGETMSLSAADDLATNPDAIK